MRRMLATGTLAGALTSVALGGGPIIGHVDFDGTELGLIGYSNSTYGYAGPGFGTNASNVSSDAFGSSLWVGGDAFWPMIRSALGPNGIGMPFSISDDSVSPAFGNTLFETDTLGFAGVALDNNGFFGVTDTENPSNAGPISAEFVFDVSGAPNLEVMVDIAAMGDFELADSFVFEYSIDGNPFLPLFTSSVDEAGSQNYFMDNPANNPVLLNDPVLMNGTLLGDDYQSFNAKLTGIGDVLTIRFTAMTDGSEAFGFDNLIVKVPAPGTGALLLAAGLVGARRRRRRF